MRKATRVAIHVGMVGAAVAAAFAASLSALAQLPPRVASDPNQREVYLVRRDQSDCLNSDVPNDNSQSVSGTIWVTRLPDGNTSLKIAINATPKTTYHFFLKCVRQLVDITTDEEGVANVVVAFPTNSVG